MISKRYTSFKVIKSILNLLSRHVGHQAQHLRPPAERRPRPNHLLVVTFTVGIFVGCAGKEDSGWQPSSDKSSPLTLYQAWGVEQTTLENILTDLGNKTVASYEAKSAAAALVHNFDFQNLAVNLTANEISLLRKKINQERQKNNQPRYAREIWQSISINPGELSVIEIEQAQKALGDWLKLNLGQESPHDRFAEVFLVDPDENENAGGELSMFGKVKSAIVSGWQLLQLGGKIDRLQNEQNLAKGVSQLADIALSPETYKTLAQNSEKIAVASELADKIAPQSELAANLKAARTINQFVIGPASQAGNIVHQMAKFIGPPRNSSFDEP